MEINPHLLEVVLSQLPDGTFSESTKPPPTSGPPTADRKKKCASPAISDVTDDAMLSIFAKNVAMEKKIVFEHTLQLNKEIRAGKKTAPQAEYLLHDLLETDHIILNLLKMKKQQKSRMEEL
eukprot:6815483-Ditylum_brightwellii.AAC.1